MITKNINGNNISSGFVSQVRSDSPNVIARLWYNNSELLCDIVDITVEKGSCGQTTFMIGDVIGDILTATVKDLSTDIKGELIGCHIGALVNGSYEYISLGRFRVSEVKKTRYESQITAYSTIVADTGTRLDVTGLNNPTIAQLASRVASKLGCTVTFDTGINTSYRVGTQLEGLTYYQALQIIAICCGGYVVNTNDGNVVVHKFNTTTNLNVDTGMMVKLPEIAEKPYTVDSVGVMVAEATTDNNGNPVDEIFYSDNPDYIIVTKQGTDYYLKARSGQLILANLKPESADIYFSCPYMTEDIFKTNIKGIKGYEYYPAQIGLTLGDPRLEGCDVLNVTDVDGNTYTVPCHKVVHKYTGGFTSVITSCEASDKANSVGTSFPITQRFETQARQIGTAQATADNAYKIAGDTNQYFWFTGSGSDTGAHITETPQDQFIADPQNGGGNLLARSNGVAIRDGLEELAIFSANQLRIGRLNAQRAVINSGDMELYNSDGEKYFEVSPDGISWGAGNNVASTEYVDDAEQDAIDTASADATAKANEARKYADNYMSFTSSGGLNIASADPATATRKVNISANGIKLQEDANNYALVSSNGLDVHKGGASVASFGTTARVGAENSSRFLMNASSLQAYNTTGKYFEVSASGMTYGTHTVADTAYADQAEADAISTASADATAKANEAKKTATNYMYVDGNGALNIASADPSTATRKVQISSSAVKVQNDANNHADVTSDGLEVVKGGSSVASFGSSARLGAIGSGHAVINGDSLTTNDSSSVATARLGAWSRLGYASGMHLMASADGLQFAGGNGRNVFDVHLTGSTTTRGLTERFNSTTANLAGTPVSGTEISVRCKDSLGSETIFDFTAGTSATKTYSKGSSNFTITYTANTSTIVASGSNSPRIVWVWYETAFPNLYTTVGIRSYGDDENDPNTAGTFSFTQGLQNRASGEGSTALNYGTASDGAYQTAVGKWNVADTTSLFIVGRGARNSRSNALIVDPDGNVKIKGKLYTNCAFDSSGGVMPVLKVTKSSVSSLPTTITNSAITSSMEVINTVLSNPSAQTGDWTVTTSNGSLTIAGSISGTTNITLYLAEPST